MSKLSPIPNPIVGLRQVYVQPEELELPPIQFQNPMFSHMPDSVIQIPSSGESGSALPGQISSLPNQVLNRNLGTEKNLHYNRCKKYLPLAACLAGFTAFVIFTTLGSISKKGSDGEKGYIAAALVTGVFFTVIGVRFNLI